MQKYQRLKCEMTQLVEEVQGLKGDVPCGDGSVSSVDLGKQVESLQHTLLDLKLEDMLGQDFVASVSQPQVALQKKLLNLLERFKKTGLVAEKGEEKPKAGDKDKTITGDAA